MFKNFKKLPEELQKIILEFANVKYRNGEYSSQIMKTDLRYNALMTIKQPIFIKTDLYNSPSNNYTIGFHLSCNLHINNYLRIHFICYYFTNDEPKKMYSGCYTYYIGNNYINHYYKTSIYNKYISNNAKNNDTIKALIIKAGVLPI